MSGLPPETLLPLRHVVYALFDAQGRLLQANEGFARLVEDAKGCQPARLLVRPTFTELAEALPEGGGWKRLHEGRVSLGAPDGVARDFRGSVHGDGARLALVLEEDVARYATLRDQVLRLNDELAEVHRQQQRDIQALRRTEKSLREAMAQIKTLQGLVPICATCKRARNDDGYWERLEDYVARHTDAQISHGICDACLATAMAELEREDGKPPAA